MNYFVICQQRCIILFMLPISTSVACFSLSPTHLFAGEALADDSGVRVDHQILARGIISSCFEVTYARRLH